MVQTNALMLTLISQMMFIDREAREIMYLVASVRPSVRPCVCLRSHGWTVWPIRGSALPSAAKSNKGHYVFVCMLGVGGLSRGCGRSAFNIFCYWEEANLYLMGLLTDSFHSKQGILTLHVVHIFYVHVKYFINPQKTIMLLKYSCAKASCEKKLNIIPAISIIDIN